jgi:hypothetical protein
MVSANSGDNLAHLTRDFPHPECAIARLKSGGSFARAFIPILRFTEPSSLEIWLASLDGAAVRIEISNLSSSQAIKVGEAFDNAIRSDEFSGQIDAQLVAKVVTEQMGLEARFS